MNQDVFRIFAISPTSVTAFETPGLTAVGGKDSGGISLNGLKHADDYAVVSPVDGAISVHPLKGNLKGPLRLSPERPVAIADLILVAARASTIASIHDSPQAKGTRFTSDLQKIVQAFAEPQDLKIALDVLLKTMTNAFGMEKGLLITRSPAADFEIVASLGVEADDSWLSETLIQDTLKSRTGTFIQNVFGSGYDSNKSLIATGFLSVFAWPLVVRGNTVGVLVVGSRKPHSGLSETEKREAEIFVQVAALILHFHLRDRRQREEIAALRKTLNPDDSPLLTQDERVLEACRIAKRVAKTDLSVLIQGDTGVGKELLANWIHQQSDRKGKPFVAVNCGAIPSELLESLLFGHKKGSFTGATSDQHGKFQLADGGTLFLDEIGDLPEGVQVKLLRALQEKQIEPVGSTKPIKVDVRIVAASHKPIAELTEAGQFREDLFYRLAEITVGIPSLGSRPNDIGLLATFFLKKLGPDKKFSSEAWAWIHAQPWRGNVRELMSAVKRAVILSASSELMVADFQTGVVKRVKSAAETDAGWLGGETLEAAKNRFVVKKLREALRRADGKRNRAAQLLGVTPRTLFRYLDEHRDELTDMTSATDKDVTVQ